MSEYRIEWSIEVEADDPEAAARLALAIQQDPDRTLSSAFAVWGKNPDEPTIVDLAAVVSILGPKAIGKTSQKAGEIARALVVTHRKEVGAMPKIKLICPSCGSDDVTRDALARWSVPEQKWEVSSELDSMQCEACDREIGPDGFASAPVEADTRDIGLAVRDFLEGRMVSIHQDNEDLGTLVPVADAAVDAIDASDPNNLIVALDNGQRFTLRVVAGA